MSPKEKKIKGDNANMLNSKGSFSYFLIQNTSKGYTYLTEHRSRHAALETLP